MRNQLRTPRAWVGRCRPLFLSVFAATLALQTAGVFAHQYVQLDYNLTMQDRLRDTVFVELFDDKPLTQANFMQYVNASKFNGTIMHRLAQDFVLQGGGFYPVFVNEPPPVNVSLDPNARVDLDGNPNTANPTIQNEYSVGTVRSNLRGTIAMARVGGQVNSATNQWFVNYSDDNDFLDGIDGGFTVFGRVMGDGMDWFDGINDGPPIYITNLNPDVDNNGVRDNGYPFWNSTANPPGSDGVPFLDGETSDLLVVLEQAKRIDYLGAGMTTTVPAGGLTFSTRDAFIDTGTNIVYEGAGGFTIGAGRTLGIREGASLPRSVRNQGTLAPGLQLGSISVQSYRQDPNATLQIQLAGTSVTNPQATFDKLVVSGGALIDGGSLDVSFVGGYLPIVNDTFSIMTAGSGIVGTFDSVNLPQLRPGQVWNMSQTASEIKLTVEIADFNRDGIVDTADYVFWRKLRGQQVSEPYARGDANGDQWVTDADRDIWRRNAGAIRGGTIGGSGSGFGASVPEPTGLATIILALCCFNGRGRRS